MIGRSEYTLSLPPPCPTNRDHLRRRLEVIAVSPIPEAVVDLFHPSLERQLLRLASSPKNVVQSKEGPDRDSGTPM